MHIAIDVRHWRDFGIGTYIRNLIRALARVDDEARYTLIGRSADLPELTEPGPRCMTAAVYNRPDNTRRCITFYFRIFCAVSYPICIIFLLIPSRI